MPPYPQADYVLVVEDHETMRHGLIQLLGFGLQGRSVHGVESGEEALQFVAQGLPVAAVIDVGLPGMDGIATTRRLRELSPQLPVVVISMHASALHEAEALEAGAVRFLTKSMMVERLVPVLAAALDSGIS